GRNRSKSGAERYDRWLSRNTQGSDTSKWDLIVKVQPMRYPEQLIAPMRKDLTQHGVLEIRTPEELKQMLRPGSGTVLMVINSVCGCAAGKARPAVGLALGHHARPDAAATVFAGADLEAVQALRELLPGHPPSSPSM